MRKTMVIAAREYSAAVKSKAFVISLVLMPVMMFGGIFVQRMTAKISDVKTKRVAIVDRTPGGTLAAVLIEAAEARNKTRIFDEQTGKQNRPRYEFERIDPAPGGPESPGVKEQRLALSERVRRDELFAFVEIGADVLKPKFGATTQARESGKELQQRGEEMSTAQQMDRAAEALGENNTVRYATNKPTAMEVRGFIQQTLTPEVYQRRLESAGLPFLKVMPLLSPPQVSTYGLTKRDASTGNITDATRDNEIVRFMVPLALLLLMFMIIMVGASPMTGNLIEEKQMRIAEVLLGSVRPFELMMGKLVGGVGVALTLALVYGGGLTYAAKQYNVLDAVSMNVVVWFFVFIVLGTLMYGAFFVAAGSAVTNLKEAQSMITPVILLMMLPMFIFESILRDPSGKLAMIGSFFPTSAPIVTVMRIAIPPGMPAWQTIGSGFVALVTTVVIIWCAGRIFRVGILMQGQGAKMGEMLKWIFRG